MAWFVEQFTSVIQLIFQIFSKLGKTLNKAASRKDLMNLALCFFTTSTPRMNFMHPPRQKKFHDIDIVFKEIRYSFFFINVLLAAEALSFQLEGTVLAQPFKILNICPAVAVCSLLG